MTGTRASICVCGHHHSVHVNKNGLCQLAGCRCETFERAQRAWHYQNGHPRNGVVIGRIVSEDMLRKPASARRYDYV